MWLYTFTQDNYFKIKALKSVSLAIINPGTSKTIGLVVILVAAVV